MKALVKSDTKPLTKQRALSESSKFFDPSGWISPVLIPFKIFLQDLWIDGLDWDTPLNAGLKSTWEAIKYQLHGLEHIRIPRWLGCISGTR